MCKTCTSIHEEINGCKEHEVISFRSNQGITKNSVCAKHPSEILRFYCVKCKIPICRDCKMTLHEALEGHKLRDLADLVQDSNEWMEKHSQQLDFQIFCSRNQIRQIHECESYIDANMTEVDASIEVLKNKLFQDISSECIKIKSQIQQKTDAQKQQLSDEKKTMEAKLSKLLSKRTYIGNVLNLGSDADVIQCKSQFSSNSDISENVESFSIILPVFVKMKSLEITLGHVKEHEILISQRLALRHSFTANIELNKSVASICLRSGLEGVLSFRSDALHKRSYRKNVISYTSDGHAKDEVFTFRPQMCVVEICGRICYYDDRFNMII